ncbi:MAG TPA: Sec-independent protein translocase subunit TatA [Microbacterium sp.]|uniref:Sec-independent protein translocase subunit TatA n=1 Tax=Microbacterium sp. TaxID=51671 RepID=UPI002BB82D1F|nr:Sec-independent protein translocase subunit TatA [Microbacterium sp.]HWI32437.1 Sec-independent protein translocase subunit TatA [Microbacterium sp.]
MLGNAFGWPHLLIILAVVLLLFGAAKLPALAKSMGQSARVFKGEMKAMKEDDATAAQSVEAPRAQAIDTPPAATTAPPTTATPVSAPAEPSGGTAEPKP